MIIDKKIFLKFLNTMFSFEIIRCEIIGIIKNEKENSIRFSYQNRCSPTLGVYRVSIDKYKEFSRNYKINE